MTTEYTEIIKTATSSIKRIFRVGDTVENIETGQCGVIAELHERKETALSGTPCLVKFEGYGACCVLVVRPTLPERIVVSSNDPAEAGDRCEGAVMPNKRCRHCHGYCPIGTLKSGLCSDCEESQSLEARLKREFALALASRSRYWRGVVVENEAK
jgi:hypothetical protein